MTDEYAHQPPVTEWKFIDQLKSPLHTRISWQRMSKNTGEANLKNGVSLVFDFPDTEGKLATAYADFRKFLAAGEIATDGRYRIITRKAPTACFEAYALDVGETSCCISADDTEGIRRGLVFLEDQITSTGGPFITMGKTSRKPLVKTRVSRCFFGPIKRLPLCRDELMDDVDYYPDEYLNRLAHEGINGLWLSIEFQDYPSRFFPEHGKDSAKRLEKLRCTVAQCARYGIRIYLYCNEPLAFGDTSHTLPPQRLDKNPWFSGHKAGKITFFCTSSAEGLQYLEECTDDIFSSVPGLGGMICITNGERPTNCYSSASSFFNNNCPRCSVRKPWDVYHDMLAAFARGMKKSAPDAVFISWLYAPLLCDDHLSAREEKFDVLRQIAAHTPEDVIMQMNFESNGLVKQLGREFRAYDYWLAWPGPSDLFRDSATNAIDTAHARASAKIQVGCSHENAAIPFMPVPGSLYRKYHAMKDLAVDAVMQCWYFGNYPGLMNKAAGELSFAPFAETEDAFLEKLARINWPGNQEKVAQAWQYFMEGYAQFPIILAFTWYGPLHCSIVWPLHLVPADQPIAPSWQFGYPDSGDRIGECICFTHTLAEVLMLLERMDENWQNGVAILSSLEETYIGDDARQMDIGLARAIGLQIRSALNAFTFYDLREKMLQTKEKSEQLALLREMETIVLEEIANSKAMKMLCLKDPRLGFHSEAEGYKFFPAKLDWRAGRLNQLLEMDFPKVTADIRQGKDLFPEYTGREPAGKAYLCAGAAAAQIESFTDGNGVWKAWRDTEKIYFEIDCPGLPAGKESVTLVVEPRRLWPALRFNITASGRKSIGPDVIQEAISRDWTAEAESGDHGWTARFTIPFRTLPWHDGCKPLRINLCRYDQEGSCLGSWVALHPLKSRLLFGEHNSADLGWLLFEDETKGSRT